MLPRLWLMHQRLQLVRRTAVALTCSWMRALLYILLPHWWAARLDDVLLGCAKCSLTFVETELGQLPVANDSVMAHPTGAGRRKSGKSRRKRARTSLVEPAFSQTQLSPTADLQPSVATAGNSLARAELICASPSDRLPGFIYLPEGVPIVRIDCWLFPQKPLAFDLLRSLNVGPTEPDKQNQPTTIVCGAAEEQEFCRSLTLASCTYGGQLTVGFTGCEHIDGQPGMALIIEAMENQLDQLYKLLDNRFPAKSVAYPPTRGFNIESTNKPSHHTGTELRKDAPSIVHEVCMRHGPGHHSAPTTPVTGAVAPQINILGGEIVEGDSSRTLKYNFPSLSSGLRRSSFRRAAYRPQQPIEVSHLQGCTEAVKLNASSPSPNRKLVPILKSPSSYCPSKENADIGAESKSSSPWRRPISRLKDERRDPGPTVQHTIASSLVKQVNRPRTVID
ncbi:hypothetical protein SprV_0501839800 [Sparganum proliferum]